METSQVKSAASFALSAALLALSASAFETFRELPKPTVPNASKIVWFQKVGV